MGKKAEVQRNYLFLTDEQKKEISIQYAAAVQSSKLIPYCEEFDTETNDGPNGQHRAQAVLAQLYLDIDSRESLESRYSIRWSTSWNLKTGAKRQRTLYQCVCGYDQKVRQQSFQSSAQNLQVENRRKIEWDRRVSYDFTGCLSHLEITEDVTFGLIIKIAGIKDHNDACKESIMKRIPYIPLHPHVYEVALQQLRIGASLSAIHKTNNLYIACQAYRGMQAYDASSANLRYIILQHDHTTLYRKFSKQNGIDLTHKSHENIHSWLNPDSPLYDPVIKKAAFHYVPRTTANDRFELGISTDEMDEAAWAFGHEKQLLLDGTFGVCTSRVLLFIAMALNDDRKGVPIAFFIFSARGGAHATHASYDTDILNKMLMSWKVHLEEKRSPFRPRVVITDNDTRERSALINVWPDIILLLCKFHLRQSWYNYRMRLLGGKRKVKKEADSYSKHVQDRLSTIEVKLIETTSHSDAVEIVDTEIEYFDKNLVSVAGSKKAAEQGIKHLQYLKREWLLFELWSSWSHRARIHASSALGIPIEGVLTTTNHLESFNGLLKRTHLKEWKKSGRRLRIDTFVHFLVRSICPEIFLRLKSDQKFKEWLKERFPQIQAPQRTPPTSKDTEIVIRCAYWQDDTSRDQEAHKILQLQRISVFSSSPTQFDGFCASSSADINDINHIRYSLLICSDGFSTCTCQDFATKTIACKHLRAMAMILSGWARARYIFPIFYPASRREAALLAQRRKIAVAQTSPNPSANPIFDIDKLTLPDAMDTIISIESQDRTITGATSEDETESESEDDSSEVEDDNERMDIAPMDVFQNNRNAIQTQLRFQFEYNVQQVIPKLYGIKRIVEEMNEESSRGPSLDQFREVISSLHWILGGNREVSESSRQQWVSADNESMVNLRGLSPQRRVQKRIDSHAPY